MLALTPAIVMAQAPADANPKMRLEAETPAIEQLIKTFKPKEGFDRAGAMIPTPLPPYNKADARALLSSEDAYRAVVGMYVLQAKAALACGEWEKSKALYEKASALAKENQASFNEGVGPALLNMWTPHIEAATKYLSEAPGRKKELEGRIAAVKKELDEAGTKKLNAAQRKDLAAKQQQMNADQNEIMVLEDNVKVHQGNLDKGKQVTDMVNEIRKIQEQGLKVIADNIGKVEHSIKTQATEIEDFNAKQLAKKKPGKPAPATGKKAWVEAVLRDHDNLGKISNATSQFDFLCRLAVLDPENKDVPKIQANIVAGRDPYFTEKPEPKAKGKGKAKKG
jgi:hypothetical protein